MTFHDVPRAGVNEVREYLGSARRIPSELERLDSIPQAAWTSAVGRGVTGAPAVGERVTAIASIDRWVYAIDTRSGLLFWRYRGSDAFGVGPVMGDGAVYAATEAGDGVVTSIDLYTGKRRWQSRTGRVAAPMVLRDSILYVSTQGGFLIALNTGDGATEWSRVAAPSRAGPLVTRSFVAVPGIIDSLFVFEATTGRPLGRVPLPSAVIAPLAMISDSLVVATSPNGLVFAIELPSGAIRWRVDAGQPIPGGPSVHADTVFAITNNCDLWQISSASPAESSPRSLGCRTRTGAAVVADGVLVATMSGAIQFYDRTRGTRRWSLPIDQEVLHPPIVRDGQIIIAPVLGDVVGYR